MKKLLFQSGVLLLLLALMSTGHAKPQAAWDTQINDPSRFQVLKQFNNEAVLDKETGLVWEQSPQTAGHLWIPARFECVRHRTVGGRSGWRLPSVHELASLVDPSNEIPALPTGHPFTNVQAAFYWTATSVADLPRDAWLVAFNNGLVGTFFKISGVLNPVWCVRGGGPLSVY